MSRPAEPRVAAILVTDAVGYSRAMSRDEEAALAALAASRRIIDAAIMVHGGRIFATAGDSVLAEFAGADQAVRCGIAFQRALAEAPAEGEGAVLAYRVGIHRGRVFGDGGDLLGDAVNIAARIESLANPGGISISGQVRDALAASEGIELEDLGPRILKNIEPAVRVLRVRLGEPDGRRDDTVSRLRVAVLPFRNLSPAGMAYLAEGLADDLITGLSRFASLAVLARSSSFFPDAAQADPRRVAADLDVQFVVQGSLRVLGDHVRIVVQLLEGRSGAALWAERYDRRLTDLIEVQDEIIHAAVATLSGRLETIGAERSRGKRTENLEAFDLLLQGIFHAHRVDPASTATALKDLERAVALDPDYALAWAWLALMRLRRWGWNPTQDTLDPASDAADRALALDPSESWCHLVAGQVALYQGDLGAAEVRHKKASSLNPYDAHVMALRSPLATYLGKPEEGIDWIERAMRLNPHHPAWYTVNLGLACYCARRYAKAAASYEGVDEPRTGALAGLAASRAQLGDADGARTAAGRLLSIEPSFSSRLFVAGRPFQYPSDADHLLAGLKRAGLSD